MTEEQLTPNADEQKPMQKMQQMQLSYQGLEDRLVFILKQESEQTNIWMTRRFTKLLLQYLDRFTATDPTVISQQSQENKQHIIDFQKQTANEKSQFERVDIPPQDLQQDKEKILAVAIAIDDNRMIRIRCNNDKTLNLAVNTHMAYLIKNLIVTTLQKTDWEITENAVEQSQVNVHYKASMTLN